MTKRRVIEIHPAGDVGVDMGDGIDYVILLREQLESIEWIYDGDCPACGAANPDNWPDMEPYVGTKGHEPDCWLGAALGRETEGRNG